MRQSDNIETQGQQQCSIVQAYSDIQVQPFESERNKTVLCETSPITTVEMSPPQHSDDQANATVTVIQLEDHR